MAPGPTRQLETLDRGLVAVRDSAGNAFVSWRVLGTEAPSLGFTLWRDGKKLTPKPLTGATCFVDKEAPAGARYTVQAGGSAPSKPVALSEMPYLNIPLRTPVGYMPNDTSVGDLDGDGALELVVHMTGRAKDNSQSGPTDPPILQAYTLDGRFLWEINLGKNIREGAHYTQFLVYDFDGDGKAEIACKTADGTVDGVGKVIGEASKSWANDKGYILEGPEFLTIFEGKTGKALAMTDYVPARGKVADWGDNYGNRVDRFLAGVAYLDGKRPSLIFSRGYYTRTVLAAWDWCDGKLTQRWVFDSEKQADPKKWRGQGNHNLSVGDVDGDGKDEVIFGAMCIDDDGTGLYSTGLGHGDALHLSDIDPSRPGLEVFDIHEHNNHQAGAELRDARTGALIFGKSCPDVGRGVAFDIDPRYPGYELWASGAGLSGVWNVKGETISKNKPRSCNFGVWWDGDFLRELLDSNRISKWDWIGETEKNLLTAEGCVSNNGTKSTPALCADILGDWREEVILRTLDGKALRIYTTTIPTTHRLTTLLHDPQYRLSVAWQNVAYNQPTQPGFYLGEK
ncbi:rhamnogalacturonan lyase [Armatimonas sp.]|uniref:rhamnogalacturonan lyase n=1 Tax=Armatimonas sp. TaxID=1872638 RepID=UPI003753C176